MLSRALRFTLFFIVLICFFATPVFANNPWKVIAEADIPTDKSLRQIVPNRYRTLRLDTNQLQHILAQAPMRFSPAALQQAVILELPMPDGTMQRFRITEAPVMHPELAAKYPQLHSYAGQGLDDPTATVRCDLTPAGFHAMILSGRHGAVFLDPYAPTNTEYYISYFQKDFNKGVQYACHAPDDAVATLDMELTTDKVIQSDGMLRTYRLALACTGEYAAFHGGTVPDVMAAFHTTMTRVNGIFERDVSIHMELIPNTDELIFLDAATDPYNYASPFENQDVCDDIIGTENYDLGHVLGVGSGGSAYRSSCCVDGMKAFAYSTLENPVGDPFDINFVAHEFGHQFGCSHTANGNCNNTPSTSVEPGNAYSVMGQDFFCDPIIEDVRGAYFHAINILEIIGNVTAGPPGTCAELTDTGNSPPTVEAADTHYFLPVSTPFKLTATGMDPDGDALTYAWEQMDNEKVTDPPVPTNLAGPAFRSYEPVEEPYRYFPSLEYIVDGLDYLWEVLPAVSRVMNFRITARDNAMGGGCTASDDVDLTFSAGAGPFLVRAPNAAETWLQNAQYTVAWEVANTDKAPISCAQVDILLSLDGGYTYPIVLASGVANDGAHTVTIPEVTTTTARIMVAAAENIFFDISDENFAIEASPAPTFNLAVDPPQREVCGLTESSTHILSLSALAGFDEEVTLSVPTVPPGVLVSFSQNPVPPNEAVEITLEGLHNVASGTYTLLLTGTSISKVIEEELVLTVNNDLPAPINLTAPANGTTVSSLRPAFEWADTGDDAYYIFEIATNPQFGNSLLATSVTNTPHYTLSQALTPLTVYYWRVIPVNACAQSSGAIAFSSFQTSGAICKEYTNREPVYIHGFPMSVSSTISIPDEFTLTDVNITMEIFHKFTGVLKADLTAASGTTIALFDRPGHPEFGPGCSGNDLLVSFDDEANNTAADFEDGCQTGTDYTIEGAFNPVESLSALNGENSSGDWTLTVTDELLAYAGVLDNWTLELCQEESVGATPDFSKMDLWLLPESSETISVQNLSASSATATAVQITYTLTELPAAGTLFLNGTAAAIGTTFTQEDINMNLLTYENSDPDATQDQFRFNLETHDGQWIPDEFLTINLGEMSDTQQPLPHLDFSLFPNPTGGEVTLTMERTSSSSLKVVVINLIGRQVAEFAFQASGSVIEQTINLERLPAGAYIIYLTDGVVFRGKKLILQ